MLVELKRKPKATAFNKNIAGFVNRLQYTLNISNEEIRDLLKFSEKEFSKFQNGEIDLDILVACSFADRFKLDIESIIENKVDFDILRTHYNGNKSVISEKYTQFAHSQKRLIITALEYVEHHRGWFAKESILRSFQLTKNLYNDPDGWINVSLFEDILQFCARYGANKSNIKEIGLYNKVVSSGTLIDKRLSTSKDTMHLYEQYFSDVVNSIEKNNYYKVVKINHEECFVESREIMENLDEIRAKHIGGPLRCSYRTGVIGVATKYLGLLEAKVTEVKCVHRGDNVCCYRIQYEHLNNIVPITPRRGPVGPSKQSIQ